MHVRQLFDLSGRVAVVTGGSRGLGLEIAEGLAQAGAAVAITGRRRQWLDPAAEQLAAAGHQVLTVEADVTTEDGVRDTLEATARHFGGIDILVNNAGIGWGEPSLAHAPDKWRMVIDTNLTGLWLMCQAAASHLIARGGGAIVNISSILGQVGIDPEIQDAVSYHASKGGVDALTRQLAVAWARHGIRVNAVAPSFFLTRMTKHQFDVAEQRMNAMAPMGRTGQAGELKGAVVFLASPAASFITGQTLTVDGGWTAW